MRLYPHAHLSQTAHGQKQLPSQSKTQRGCILAIPAEMQALAGHHHHRCPAQSHGGRTHGLCMHPMASHAVPSPPVGAAATRWACAARPDHAEFGSAQPTLLSPMPPCAAPQRVRRKRVPISRQVASTCQAPTQPDSQPCQDGDTLQQRTASHPCQTQITPCQPPSQQLTTQPASCDTTRRATCAAVLATAVQAALPAAPAHALKTVTLRDGSQVEVFEHGMSLNIVSLRGSIPQDWILNYKATLGKYAGFTLGQRGQIEEIYKELSDPPNTKNSCSVADVVTLGDVWLGPAIKAGLVQPIPNADKSRWWRWLSPKWQALVRRDAQGHQSATGDVYAAPYRWGATLIAYRKDRLLQAGGHVISDWCDLLQPQLAQRVAMTDSSREFLGAALKAATTSSHHGQDNKGAPGSALGFNACAKSLASRGIGVAEVAEAAAALRKQVKLFSRRDHVRAFATGDVWAVVGWSQDLITLAERSNMVEVIVPSSGTALFADLWTVPAKAEGGHMQTGPSPLLPSWLEFSIVPGRVPALGGLKTGASPLLLDNPVSPLRSQAMINPEKPMTDHEQLVLSYESGYLPTDGSCLRNSEFLLPLDAETLRLYSDALAMTQTQKIK